MENPFETIQKELADIKELFAALPKQSTPPEIISRDELLRRLDISEPTLMKYVRKGRIPEIRIGQVYRYNWPSVVMALENCK